MKSKIIIILSVLILLTFDRYLWMPQRVNGVWINERGRNLGDPMAYEQDFKLKNSEIIFNNNKSKEDYPYVYRNRQSKFYLLGCYFGNLYILDKTRIEIIVYSDN